MNRLDGHLGAVTAAPQLAETINARQQQNAKRTTVADVLDGVSTGIDGVSIATEGCKVIADAVKPTHLTGGKELPAVFVTGGGDGLANGFQTVADCAPVAEVATEVADAGGALTDVLGVAGDIVSGAVDVASTVVGGIVSGIADGL